MKIFIKTHDQYYKNTDQTILWHKHDTNHSKIKHLFSQSDKYFPVSPYFSGSQNLLKSSISNPLTKPFFRQPEE